MQQLIDDKNQPVWSWDEFSNGLPAVDGKTSWVTQMLLNSYRGDRVFLAIARNNDAGGGLYLLEPPDSDTWQPIYDGDYMDGDGGDGETYGDSNRYRDFRALAQSADGSWLYAGTRGFSSGLGGLLVCKDTSLAAEVGELGEDDPIPAVLEEWEILANDPDNTIRPFEYYLNLPFWWEDYPDHGSADYIDKKTTWVKALAVNPRNRRDVYVGLMDNGMSARAGLWRYDGRGWEHVSPNQLFKGVGILSLEFNPYVPGQLLVGTNGQGLYLRTLENEE